MSRVEDGCGKNSTTVLKQNFEYANHLRNNFLDFISLLILLSKHQF